MDTILCVWADLFHVKSTRGRRPRLPVHSDSVTPNGQTQRPAPMNGYWEICGVDIIPLRRADAAVRPYAEDLLHVKSCVGRLPRLPTRFDDQHAQTIDRVVT